MVGSIAKVIGLTALTGFGLSTATSSVIKSSVNFVQKGSMWKTFGYAVLGGAAMAGAGVALDSTIREINELIGTPEVQRAKRVAKTEVREQVVEPIERAVNNALS